MSRMCMLNGLQQTYPNMVHIVNITLDKDSVTKDLSPLYEDLLQNNSHRLQVTYSENEGSRFTGHFNNMRAIQSVPDLDSYDLFIKNDDDDIYKSDYVKNIVDLFVNNKDVDITSTSIAWQLNGYDLYRKGPARDLGGNPPNTDYRMPMTFAFNRRALDVIIGLTEADICGFDDKMWRVAWAKEGLRHRPVGNEQEIIWHVHGKNASTSDFLIQK